VKLSTERLTLREFEESDWRATQQYESDPDVVRYQSNEVLSPEESRAYIRSVLEAARESPRKIYDFAVTLKSDGLLIGRCGMKLTGDREAREAMVWFVSNPKYWGQGYITEATEALLAFGFNELKLHRVYGDCDPRNPASARVMEKLGMRREAHFKENAWIKGEWCDSLIYAVLEREWRARTPAT
jgi:[ribosomal protein S5]-alanine N-acetyltransferase